MSNPNRIDLDLNSTEDHLGRLRKGIVSAERLIGRRVRVESEGEYRFEGILARLWEPERHVLLRPARELPGGARYLNAFVPQVNWIVTMSSGFEIAELDVEQITTPQFAVAEFDPTTNSRAIKQAAHHGFVGNLPVVTRQGDQFVLVERHKSHWVAEQAGLESQPVIIEMLSERECAARFAYHHFPLPHDLRDDCDQDDEFYSDSELRASIKIYFDMDRANAMEIYPVRFNADRLGMA